MAETAWIPGLGQERHGIDRANAGDGGQQLVVGQLRQQARLVHCRQELGESPTLSASWLLHGRSSRLSSCRVRQSSALRFFVRYVLL